MQLRRDTDSQTLAKIRKRVTSDHKKTLKQDILQALKLADGRSLQEEYWITLFTKGKQPLYQAAKTSKDEYLLLKINGDDGDEMGTIKREFVVNVLLALVSLHYPNADIGVAVGNP